jgi:transposase InsO family protein
MKTIMNANDLTSIGQVRDFLAGTQRVAFEVAGNKQSRYDRVRRTLVKFNCLGCNKSDKGVLTVYLMKVSGYSLAQVKRLIKRYRETGELAPRHCTARGFARRYTKADIRLLAAMDERHNTPNGLALRQLCERAYAVFGQPEYERLAGISVSHLYHLRQSQTCRRQRHTVDKTRPVTLPIGERRKPQPDGQPGYIRIDTVRQGDVDGEKGVYHINAVDEATQFEVVVSVERISETYLIPALEYLLEAFPFVVLGFHADNGSEYINKEVARLLEKLRIELTRSRARHSNDNALLWWCAGTATWCASCWATPTSRGAGPAR